MATCVLEPLTSLVRKGSWYASKPPFSRFCILTHLCRFSFLHLKQHIWQFVLSIFPGLRFEINSLSTFIFLWLVGFILVDKFPSSNFSCSPKSLIRLCSRSKLHVMHASKQFKIWLYSQCVRATWNRKEVFL